MRFMPVYTAFCILVFWRLRLYKSIWRFASYSELTRVTMATVVTSVFHIVGITCLCHLMTEFRHGRMPISYHAIGIMLQFLMVLGIRFSYRFVLLQRARRRNEMADDFASRVMLIGAGSAGQMILRDIKRAKETNEKVCCIIDDDSNKWNRFIDGIPVVGGRDMILKAAADYHIQQIF